MEQQHCPNCRAPVPPGASYCARCGKKAADLAEDETRVAQRRGFPTEIGREAGEVERVIFAARPTLLFVGLGYVIAALFATAAVILLAYAGVSAFASLLVALFFLLFPAYYHVRRNSQRYTLTDARVEIDRGFFVRTTRNIPLHKIQDVTVSASLFKRLLGMGDVIIENASEQGGVTVLRNISDPRAHADLLLRELRRWR